MAFAAGLLHLLWSQGRQSLILWLPACGIVREQRLAYSE